MLSARLKKIEPFFAATHPTNIWLSLVELAIWTRLIDATIAPP
jgi:hypothetical protein